MDELTKRRLKHNEELFRSINEEVNEAHADSGGGTIGYLCECSDRNCQERVFLTEAEYQSIRSDERKFIIVPGHGVPGLEEAVDRRGDQYEVVQKGDEAV